MLVNVSDVLTLEGKEEKLQLDLEMETYANQHGTYRITGKTPITLALFHTGNGKAHMEGSITLTMLLSCDRCLKEVNYEFGLSFAQELLSPEAYAAAGQQEEGREFMEGYSLAIEDLVKSEISIHWPMKVLCNADCKGICGQCGKDLNEGECGCDAFIPDPRMAVIQDIFHAGKEV